MGNEVDRIGPIELIQQIELRVIELDRKVDFVTYVQNVM